VVPWFDPACRGTLGRAADGCLYLLSVSVTVMSGTYYQYNFLIRPPSPEAGKVSGAQVPDNHSWYLMTHLLPTRGSRRSAFVAGAVVILAFGIAIPISGMHLRPLDAFIPTIQGMFFINDLITAILLFSQFSISRSRAMLILASGYLFSSLSAIPFVLTFPGAFSSTGLLGAGLQSAAWIYGIGHCGFCTSIMAYAWLTGRDPGDIMATRSARSAIGWTVVIVIGLVSSVTWFATAHDDLMPMIFYDRLHTTSWVYFTAGLSVAPMVLAFLVLWKRGRSLLDQWLMVVALAVISEMVLGVSMSGRFDLGYYSGRLYTLVSSIIVLAVLLSEVMRLDAHLARSNLLLQNERDNKLMNLAAMAASISHEVRQPLMAMAMNAGAATQYLGHAPPSLEKIRSALSTILTDGHRANQILASIGSLFEGGDPRQAAVDMNEVVAGALDILRADLNQHGVTVRTELTAGIPIIVGHRGQLQEVILNLVNNATEAMNSSMAVTRAVQLKTESSNGEVVVTVEDSGPGIDSKEIEHLFDVFVTSKRDGMGLGLAICRTIVERHGGQIAVGPGAENGGAVFRFTLPVGSAEARQ